MSDKTKELIEIIDKHPDHELIFMYPEDNSGWRYTLGHPTRIVVDEYWDDPKNERVWLREDDKIELFEDYVDRFYDSLFVNEEELSHEQDIYLEHYTNNYIKERPWKKCICVYIEP